MLRTGREYLEGLCDGRAVYLGNERVVDVVSHVGFRSAARTIAAMYDLKFDTAYRADLVVDDGEQAPYSTYFLAPHSPEDLEKRRRCHQHIADLTFGLCGRSPDHVASLVTGLAMDAGTLDAPGGRSCSENLLGYYRDARARDAYIVYAVLPNKELPGARVSDNPDAPGLRVVREDDDGVVLRGVKALATGAVLADEIWIGNLQPLSAGQEMEAITCVVSCAAPGVQLWSRKAFASSASAEFDSPLTWRYDEGDAVLVCEDVKVDWSRVFVHGDLSRSSDIYLRTPAHALANHQSAVRSLSKTRFLVGLAHRIASATGAIDTSAVRETLGRLAALEATIAALVDAQVSSYDCVETGGICPNRRYVYAALNWCQETLSVLVDVIRDLSGAGAFKFPATIDVVGDPQTRPAFARFWSETGLGGVDHMQIFKLSWDIVGSEFAGRQQVYERFYAGPPHVVRSHSYRESPWDELSAIVTRVMSQCAMPMTISDQRTINA